MKYELPANQALEIGYMGNSSRHLEALRAGNEATPSPTGTIASRSPFPKFGRLQLADNGGYGNCNGLSAKLTKRYSAGLTYMLGYTWSNTIDTGSAIRVHDGDTLFPQNSNCRPCDYRIVELPHGAPLSRGANLDAAGSGTYTVNADCSDVCGEQYHLAGPAGEPLHHHRRRPGQPAISLRNSSSTTACFAAISGSRFSASK